MLGHETVCTGSALCPRGHCRLPPAPAPAPPLAPCCSLQASAARLSRPRSWAVSSSIADARGLFNQQGGGGNTGPGVRGRAYRVLLAEPVELLELLRHQQLGAAHGTPDLAENCKSKRGHAVQLSRSKRVTRGCVCVCECVCERACACVCVRVNPETRTPPSPLPGD